MAHSDERIRVIVYNSGDMAKLALLQQLMRHESCCQTVYEMRKKAHVVVCTADEDR